MMESLECHKMLRTNKFGNLNGQIQRKHIEWSLWMVLEATKGVSVLLPVNNLSILILHKVQWLKKSCRIGPKEHYSMLFLQKASTIWHAHSITINIRSIHWKKPTNLCPIWSEKTSKHENWTIKSCFV